MKIIIPFFSLLISFSAFAAKPQCVDRSGVKGWVLFDSRFVPDTNCSTKEVVCEEIGSRSEGWYIKTLYPIKNYNRIGDMTCDSVDGKDLLDLKKDYYICKDNIVNQINLDLLDFDNCAK